MQIKNVFSQGKGYWLNNTFSKVTIEFTVKVKDSEKFVTLIKKSSADLKAEIQVNPILC